MVRVDPRGKLASMSSLAQSVDGQPQPTSCVRSRPAGTAFLVTSAAWHVLTPRRAHSSSSEATVSLLSPRHASVMTVVWNPAHDEQHMAPPRPMPASPERKKARPAFALPRDTPGLNAQAAPRQGCDPTNAGYIFACTRVPESYPTGRQRTESSGVLGGERHAIVGGKPYHEHLSHESSHEGGDAVQCCSDASVRGTVTGAHSRV